MCRLTERALASGHSYKQVSLLSIWWRQVWPAALAKRTVQDSLLNHVWTHDLRGSLSPMAILQFLDICPMITGQELQEGLDSWRWKWTMSREHSSSSAYQTFFASQIGCGWESLFGGHGLR